MRNPSITYEQLCDLHDLLEDAISFYCDENQISGEAAWLFTKGFALIKLEQLSNLP
mgnify:CR=1 FL=1